jgi:hypothetical protein
MAAILSEKPVAGPNAISEALAQITKRLRLVRWVRHAARGALAGIVLALIAVALAHFDLLPDWLPLEAVIPIPILLGVFAGTVTTFLRPISRMDAARLAEARLGLKERLSSALEFESALEEKSDPESAILRRLQLADAASHARSLNAAQAVPLRLPWEVKASAAGLLLIALALIVPALPVFVPPGIKLERRIVQKTGGKLEQTAKLIQKQADLQHLNGTRRASAAMQRLAQKLAAGHLDKKQAMVQMSKLTQQMRQDLQKTAQANSSAAGAGGKSMAQAGQQLAQALAGGQNASGSGKQAGTGQKAGGSSSKSGQKAGQNGGSGSKNGAGDKFNGFNLPAAGKSSAHQNNPSSPQTPSAPELKKAAQAMQQNDSQALSQQLRQMADRIQSGKLSPAEQQQAAADTQKLADALKNTPMPETQAHAQAAADALKRGDKQAAASEMRKAADSAEREAQEQTDQQGQQDAQQSVEDAESEMAGANSPGDIQDDSGQPGQGQGKGKGQGSGQGQAAGDGLGDGQGMPGANGKHGSGKGNGGSGGGGMAGGTPRDTGEGSSPLKHLGKAAPALNPKSIKLYFGKPLNNGPSKTGPTRKVSANPNAVPGPTASNVPYYNYVAPAQKSAESAMDKEDIPPAYRSDVRRYFNSLTPPAGK